MLTRETFRGPWAVLPIAWNEDGTFDEATYREDVARYCAAGVPGVYTGGTTGEFYALEFEEFAAVTDATIAEARQAGVPAMIGCTSTFTRGAIRRACYAQDAGADAVQIAIPYWMALTDPEIITFYTEVAVAIPGLPISLYETQRAKRALPLEVHQTLHVAIPDIVMVKANENTLGDSPEGCAAISKLYNVFVGEHEICDLGPFGACGSCSSLIYMNPPFVLRMYAVLAAGDWAVLKPMTDQVLRFFTEGLDGVVQKGCADSAIDRVLGRRLGFLNTSLHCRGPYLSCTQEDEDLIREWLQQNTPELAELAWRRHAMTSPSGFTITGTGVITSEPRGLQGYCPRVARLSHRELLASFVASEEIEAPDSHPHLARYEPPDWDEGVVRALDDVLARA